MSSRPSARTIIHLCLIGPHEIFGLDEIAQDTDRRLTTVTCASNQATVYFMKRDEFIKSVNLYKLSDTVLQERYIKQHLYIRRM